jgi:serine/threonine-protein kinase RsbT
MTTQMAAETKVPISSDADIVVARQKGRELAGQLGFSSTDSTLIATAISELARNIVLYAKHGEIVLSAIHNGGKSGIVVVAQDEGPGIPNVEQAMQGGYSTSRSLGLGLPGVKRLMDQFEILSKLGKGTIVTVRKWRDGERDYVLPAVT